MAYSSNPAQNFVTQMLPYSDGASSAAQTVADMLPYSAANPITVTSMEMQIDAGIWAAESGTSTVIFDNFNNIPTTSTNTSGFFGFM